MRIVRDLQELSPFVKASVATIGNFDGVHLAHQRLLGRVVEVAHSLDAAAVAVTFDPHPIKVLAPERAPRVLTPPEVKARLIEQLGIEILLVLPFTREFSQLSPFEFVRLLTRRLQAVSLHVGPNFRFGHRHAGEAETLQALAGQDGCKVEVLPVVAVRGQQVSSSRIRELLTAGQVGKAGRLLGRPFANYGHIVAGSGVGKKETVPTLNLEHLEAQTPKVGVYVTRTRIGQITHDSVTNVGHKPTFGPHRLTVESYLLNFADEIRASEMQVEYLHRLRDEIKFPNPASLKAQIQRDVSRSVKFFRLLKVSQDRSVAARSGNSGASN